MLVTPPGFRLDDVIQINNLHAAQTLSCFLCNLLVVTGALICVLAGDWLLSGKPLKPQFFT